MSKRDEAETPAPRRKRRTAEEARRAILDAAALRLTEEGPDGLKLQAIAQDVGISHSAILHHFGSREKLLEELRTDGFEGLARELKERLQRPDEVDSILGFFEKIAVSLGSSVRGRLFVWQVLTGYAPERASVGEAVLGADGAGGLLDGLAQRLHALRAEEAEARGLAEPSLDESRRIMALSACLMIGEATAGHVMLRSSRLGQDPETREAFQAWLPVQLARLATPGPGPTTAPPLRTEGDTAPRATDATESPDPGREAGPGP